MEAEQQTKVMISRYMHSFFEMKELVSRINFDLRLKRIDSTIQRKNYENDILGVMEKMRLFVTEYTIPGDTFINRDRPVICFSLLIGAITIALCRQEFIGMHMAVGAIGGIVGLSISRYYTPDRKTCYKGKMAYCLKQLLALDDLMRHHENSLSMQIDLCESLLCEHS